MASYKRPTIVRPAFEKRTGPSPNPGPLTGRLADMMAPKNTRVWEYSYKPIKYIDAHVNSMRLNGASQEEIDSVIAKNNSVPHPKPSVTIQTKTSSVLPYAPLVQGPDEFNVKLHVSSKTGTVKVKIVNPYHFLLKHSRKGKPVPIESFVQFHKLNGAPDEYLLDILEKHSESVKRRSQDHAKLDSIFDKYASSTKKSAPQKVISIVKKLPPMF